MYIIVNVKMAAPVWREGVVPIGQLEAWLLLRVGGVVQVVVRRHLSHP